MFKKNKIEEGNLKLYTVFSHVSKKYIGTFQHTTDEEMIQISLPSILMDFALRDISIYRIGSFDDSTGEIFPNKKVLIPTDCYTFPHSRLSSEGDDLSLEDLDKAMKEKKAELVAKISVEKTENKENKGE